MDDICTIAQPAARWPLRIASPPGHVRIALLTTLATLSVQVGLVAARLGGGFVYTLDDPYIHLALADQIVRGHYGLMAGVAAAPSSSILYPFVLAVLSSIGLGEAGPLVVNIAATLASVALLATLAVEALPELATLGVVPSALLVLAASSCLNLSGVALTGMEHGLQVALTLAWLLGARRFLCDGRIRPWWWACAVLLPLVRYEGAGLWLATVALLALRRRTRAGAALGLAGAVPLCAFSLFLHAQGLGWLPSSVLVKSDASIGGVSFSDLGPAARVLATVGTNLLARGGRPFLCATLGVAWLVVRLRRSPHAADRAPLVLALVALAVSAAQLSIGRIDGYTRYEVHALALDAAVLLIGFAPDLRRLAAGRGRWALAAATAVALLVFEGNVERSWHAGSAAHDVYAQQHQMHRMAADLYRGAVAVNDIGQVSYRNPYPVLDLWGLGSEETRLARRADPTGRWVADLVERHDVGLVMIYDPWFPAVPPSWIPAARLSLDTPPESVARPTVTFYATAPGRLARVEAAVDALGASLPDGVTLRKLTGRDGPARR